MIIDFQHHYTPPQLLKGKKDEVSVGIDERGNPMHLLNPLLGDIDAHVRGDRPPVEPALVGELQDIDEGRPVIDVRQRAKQPDWSFDEEWSGKVPAELFGEHRAERDSA